MSFADRTWQKVSLSSTTVASNSVLLRQVRAEQTADGMPSRIFILVDGGGT